jgi:hypothetical protein
VKHNSKIVVMSTASPNGSPSSGCLPVNGPTDSWLDFNGLRVGVVPNGSALS